MKKGYLSIDLASILDLDRSWWNQIENGKQPTSARTAKRVSEILDSDFDEIFEIR